MRVACVTTFQTVQKVFSFRRLALQEQAGVRGGSWSSSYAHRSVRSSRFPCPLAFPPHRVRPLPAPPALYPFPHSRTSRRSRPPLVREQDRASRGRRGIYRQGGTCCSPPSLPSPTRGEGHSAFPPRTPNRPCIGSVKRGCTRSSPRPIATALPRSASPSPRSPTSQQSRVAASSCSGA